MASPLSAPDLLAQALPDLKISPDPCQCRAPHDIKYIASLKSWPDFKSNVVSDFQCKPWSQTTLSHSTPDSTPESPTDSFTDDDEYSPDLEYVEVGTEHGVRGRFQQRVGQYVDTAFNEQQIDLVFADFKCQSYVMPDEQAPNPIIMTRAGGTRVIGEVRVDWIDQYDIELMVGDTHSGNDTRLRHGIGQLARSMKEMDIKYGFLSNYNQIVFLRQVSLPNWIGLEYSPVFYHDEKFDASGGIVSLRQAFFYVGNLARDPWSFTDASSLQPQQQAWTVFTV